MIPDMYILTDANGFTTCCYANMDDLLRESGRVPLLAPVTVYHWELFRPVSDRREYYKEFKWRKVAEMTWNGGPALWH